MVRAERCRRSGVSVKPAPSLSKPRPFERVRCCASSVPGDVVIGAPAHESPTPRSQMTAHSPQPGSGEGAYG